MILPTAPGGIGRGLLSRDNDGQALGHLTVSLRPDNRVGARLQADGIEAMQCSTFPVQEGEGVNVTVNCGALELYLAGERQLLTSTKHAALRWQVRAPKANSPGSSALRLSEARSMSIWWVEA